MTYQPIIPFGGMAGWAFLQRTKEQQEEAFSQSASLQKELTYFKENIGTISNADELVGNYRLLKVALGAFGLENDLPNKALIKKVLEEGSLNPNSFANRMVNKSYLTMTKAFGFDLAPPSFKLSDFADKIAEQYTTRQFEIAVGNTNEDFRFSLTLERELSEMATASNTDDGRWYTVFGSEPLRHVMQTALGLPSSIASLDIDKQVKIFREKTQAAFGNGEIAQFSDPSNREKLNQLFLARSQISGTSSFSTPASVAVTLLQNAGY